MLLSCVFLKPCKWCARDISMIWKAGQFPPICFSKLLLHNESATAIHPRLIQGGGRLPYTLYRSQAHSQLNGTLGSLQMAPRSNFKRLPLRNFAILIGLPVLATPTCRLTYVGSIVCYIVIAISTAPMARQLLFRN